MAVMRAFDWFLANNPGAVAKLVIKTNTKKARPADLDRFQAAIERHRDAVVLIDQTLSDTEIKNLVRACDCFVSLHRAEGFGRGPAEAMFYGKPVIATGYSGVMDFMTPETSCLVDYDLVPVPEGAYPFGHGQSWAEPNIDQAASFMTRLYDDRAYGAALGAAASRRMRTHFGARAAGLRFLNRLREIGFSPAR